MATNTLGAAPLPAAAPLPVSLPAQVLGRHTAEIIRLCEVDTPPIVQSRAKGRLPKGVALIVKERLDRGRHARAFKLQIELEGFLRAQAGLQVQLQCAFAEQVRYMGLCSQLQASEDEMARQIKAIRTQLEQLHG